MIVDSAALARHLATRGELEVPLPGSGRTTERFTTLTGLCRQDIPMGRLIEAHLDADAILAELSGERAGPDEFWGVWAAEPPGARLTATRDRGRWQLTGTKPWCSGVLTCTNALVTAHDGEERRLFAVDLRQPGVRPEKGGWAAAGMRSTETGTAVFDRASARPVGGPGDYLDRPGFWHGGIGVAACWFGGAQKVAATLYEAAPARGDDITLMHLGAVDALLGDGSALLADAARTIDADPTDTGVARRLAFVVRWRIEQVATCVIDRVNRALGPAPLVHDRAHSRAVADLSVYVRQSHADHDLLTLGRLAAAEGPRSEGAEGVLCPAPDRTGPATGDNS